MLHAVFSMWYSDFNKSQFILIYKLIKSPDIFFQRLFMLMKTQNILSDSQEKGFLKTTRASKRDKNRNESSRDNSWLPFSHL